MEIIISIQKILKHLCSKSNNQDIDDRDHDVKLVTEIWRNPNNVKTKFNLNNVKRLGTYDEYEMRPIMVKMN